MRGQQPVVDNSCAFGGFAKFGGYWFPREVVCDQHKIIEAKVVDLVAEPSPDTALFTPPAGATELGRCTDIFKPPTAVFSPAPNLPLGWQYQVPSTGVRLSLIVDTKGKPQNVKVLHPGLKNFDQLAITTVRNWRFKPATCNGEPMPTEINVEIQVQLFR